MDQDLLHIMLRLLGAGLLGALIGTLAP